MSFFLLKFNLFLLLLLPLEEDFNSFFLLPTWRSSSMSFSSSSTWRRILFPFPSSPPGGGVQCLSPPPPLGGVQFLSPPHLWRRSSIFLLISLEEEFNLSPPLLPGGVQFLSPPPTRGEEVLSLFLLLPLEKEFSLFLLFLSLEEVLSLFLLLLPLEERFNIFFLLFPLEVEFKFFSSSPWRRDSISFSSSPFMRSSIFSPPEFLSSQVQYLSPSHLPGGGIQYPPPPGGV